MVENLEFTISTFYKCLMKKTGVPKLRQEVKGKVDIVTSDDIKIYNTGKFQGFLAKYMITVFSLRLGYGSPAWLSGKVFDS